MNSFLFLPLVFFLSALIFTGCASSQAKNEVDRKVAAAQGQYTADEIRYEVQQSIINSNSLSAEQKGKISGILAETREKNNTFKVERDRLIIALFQTVGEPNLKAEEIDIIKFRLKSLEKKRSELMLSSLDTIKDILGVSRQPASEIELNRFYRNEF